VPSLENGSTVVREPIYGHSLDNLHVKGTEPILLLLLIFSCTVLFMSVSHDVDAATTYVEGDWAITNRTTLSGGTWWVNGTIEVRGSGDLRLVDAELVVQTPSGKSCGIFVNDQGQLYVQDSTVRGVTRALEIHIQGQARFIDSRISFCDDAWSGGISYQGFALTLSNCTLENGSRLLEAYSDFLAESCSFRNFDYGVYLGGDSGIPIAALQKKSWAIRECTFAGDSAGTGVALYTNHEGAMANISTSPPDLIVYQCRFSGLLRAVDVDLYDGRSAWIEKNVAWGCAFGLSLSCAMNTTDVWGNNWTASDTAVRLQVETSLGPNVATERISGGICGLLVVSLDGAGRTSVTESDIHGGDVGVRVDDARVTLAQCYVRAGGRECELSGSGWLHLRQCDHTRSGRVLQGDGEIAEVVDTHFHGVVWHNGPAIERPMVRFRHELGYASPVVAEINQTVVWLPLWHVAKYWNVKVTQLWAELSQGPVAFFSVPFAPGDEIHPLVIIDDFVPIVEGVFPAGGSLVAGRLFNFSCNITEYGAGIARVLVRLGEGPWSNVTEGKDGVWSAPLDCMVDGQHDVLLSVTDLAMNSMTVGPVAFEVDGTLPFIEVIFPGPCTRNSTVRLVARTEVGSRATVGGLDVPVGASGMFGVDLQLFEGINSIHIEVIDRAGNVNETTFFLELDVTPPFLRIDAPREGRVIPSTLVQVVGSAEQNASVRVDGLAAHRSGEVFSVLLVLEDGEHLITVVATDPAGNWAACSVSVRVDTLVPTLAIEAPLEGTLTCLPRTLVTGVVEDAGDVTVSVYGQAAEVIEGRWSMPVVLGEGENVISVRAVDEAGNEVVRTVRVTLDSTPPVVAAELELGVLRLAPGDPTPVTGCATATLRLNFSEGGRLSITGVEATHVAAGNISFVLQLVHGMNWIVARTSDDLGNIGPTFTFNVTRDDIPPPLGIMSPKQGSRVEGPSVTLKGVTEPGAVVLVNGTEVRIGADGTFTALLRPGPGHHAILVTSTDPCGNSVNATVKFDLVEPSKPGLSGLRIPTGLGIATFFIAMLALLVVLVARARARARTATHRDDGGESPGNSVQEPRGVGVRVRRGR
jgi:hypothetical protein